MVKICISFVILYRIVVKHHVNVFKVKDTRHFAFLKMQPGCHCQETDRTIHVISFKMLGTFRSEADDVNPGSRTYCIECDPLHVIPAHWNSFPVESVSGSHI